MKPELFLGILLLILVSGCVNPQIEAGNPAEYELPGLNNTTVFYLSDSSVQVVENVVNQTSVDFIINGNPDTNFRNPVAVDYSGKNVSFNASMGPVLGKSYIQMSFSSPFSGWVAYTQPGGGDFIYPITKNGTIRVVLPLNYTATSKFLGLIQPPQYNITQDSSGREVIIWEKPNPEDGQITVKYQHKDAPTLLSYFFFSLFIFFIFVMGYYMWNINELKKKRIHMEKDIRKKT
ncbi:MAG: DUF5803 family protein [Candidatus Methanoperedens sp.]|nr:DUF5803 family protein [Candidatus Methanoperedens sp.]